MKNQKNSKLKRNSRKISKINPQKILKKNLKKNLKNNSKNTLLFLSFGVLSFLFYKFKLFEKLKNLFSKTYQNSSYENEDFINQKTPFINQFEASIDINNKETNSPNNLWLKILDYNLTYRESNRLKFDLNLIVDVLPKNKLNSRQTFNLSFNGNSFDPNDSKLERLDTYGNILFEKIGMREEERGSLKFLSIYLKLKENKLSTFDKHPVNIITSNYLPDEDRYYIYNNSPTIEDIGPDSLENKVMTSSLTISSNISGEITDRVRENINNILKSNVEDQMTHIKTKSDNFNKIIPTVKSKLSNMKLDFATMTNTLVNYKGRIERVDNASGQPGPPGVIGPPGEDSEVTGPKGYTGNRGPTGDKGETGIQGIKGIQGLLGDKGNKPVQKGMKGETGIKGKTGERGIRGDGILSLNKNTKSFIEIGIDGNKKFYAAPRIFTNKNYIKDPSFNALANGFELWNARNTKLIDNNTGNYKGTNQKYASSNFIFKGKESNGRMISNYMLALPPNSSCSQTIQLLKNYYTIGFRYATDDRKNTINSKFKIEIKAGGSNLLSEDITVVPGKSWSQYQKLFKSTTDNKLTLSFKNFGSSDVFINMPFIVLRHKIIKRKSTLLGSCNSNGDCAGTLKCINKKCVRNCGTTKNDVCSSPPCVNSTRNDSTKGKCFGKDHCSNHGNPKPDGTCACTGGRIGAKCSQCGKGHFEENGRCVKCDPGFYQDKVGQKGRNSCKPCPAGHVSGSPGAERCSPCPPGKFQEGSNKISCKECDKGYHQKSAGQTSCTICPANEYQDQKGQKYCKDCEYPTMRSGPGAIRCHTCSKPENTHWSGRCQWRGNNRKSKCLEDESPGCGHLGGWGSNGWGGIKCAREDCLKTHYGYSDWSTCGWWKYHVTCQNPKTVNV